jgi:hypothetical protein
MRFLPVLAALVLLVAYGVAEALWTHRWTSSHEAEQATTRLASVPKTLGDDWESVDEQLPPRQAGQLKEVGMTGYLLRRYYKKGTRDRIGPGNSLQVQLFCGPPGPVSLHTPEVCFEGVGFHSVGTKAHQEYKFEGGSAEFWVARFQKEGDFPEPRRASWSWSATGRWQAPDHPRFNFGSHAALYKLYVIYPFTNMEDLSADPTAKFLEQFLPELNKVLFPAAGAAGKMPG